MKESEQYDIDSDIKYVWSPLWFGKLDQKSHGLLFMNHQIKDYACVSVANIKKIATI